MGRFSAALISTPTKGQGIPARFPVKGNKGKQFCPMTEVRSELLPSFGSTFGPVRM